MTKTTDAPSVWTLVKQGKFEEACVRADAEFLETRSTGRLSNKIFALLHLKKFDEVVELCHKLIALNSKYTSESDYQHLGVALWLKGDFRPAIEAWKSGLNAQYKDAAGGVEMPMLLIFAAVMLQDKELENEALRLLKKRSRSKRMVNWPGALVPYWLGQISEEELRSQTGTTPILHERQMCQAEFYVGLKRLVAGDKAGFEDRLAAAVGYGRVSPLEREFYLAKGLLENKGKELTGSQ